MQHNNQTVHRSQRERMMTTVVTGNKQLGWEFQPNSTKLLWNSSLRTFFWPFFGIFFLIGRKEYDIIGICSRHFGIAKNLFPIFHIVYCSYVEKLWNSVGIPSSCFLSREIFQQCLDQNCRNSKIGTGIPNSATPRNQNSQPRQATDNIQLDLCFGCCHCCYH